MPSLCAFVRVFVLGPFLGNGVGVWEKENDGRRLWRFVQAGVIQGFGLVWVLH